MHNTQYKRAVGLFHSRHEAERVVRSLRDSGYDMDRVSVIAKDADQVAGHDTSTTKEIGNKADEGATTGAITGGALGGITGLLVGLGALAIPGIGPILLAGAEATAIATTVAGGAIGAAAGSLVGALIGLGIPEEKARVYSDRVNQGNFLVMVTGTVPEIANVRSIMSRHSVDEFEVYDATAPENVPAPTTTPQPTVAPTTEDRDNIKLYEERLVVDKERHKAGEVTLGKKVETDTANLSVPVEKERIVIERQDTSETRAVDPKNANFQDGEVARMNVYEESADIEKQAFVREEVSVRKEVERDTVEATETIRKEELEIDTEGNIIQK